MGTRFELVLCESDRYKIGTQESLTHLRAVGEEAIEEIQTWDRTLSRFSPGSVTTRLIAAATNVRENGRPQFVSVDARLFALLKFCEAMRVMTAGAFDVSYESNRASDFAAGIELNTVTCGVRLMHKGQSLDFGAVGKGFALDCVAELLREHGITRAFVHGGTSSVVALGQWNVGMKLNDHCHCVVHMENAHLSVSSTRNRSHIINSKSDKQRDDQTRAHTTAILAPLDVQSEAASGAGTLAEGWSTALTVLGTRTEIVPPSLTTLIAREGSKVECLGPDAWRFDVKH